MRTGGWLLRAGVVAVVVAAWVAIVGWPGGVSEGRARSNQDSVGGEPPPGPALPVGVERPQMATERVRKAPDAMRQEPAAGGYVKLPDGSYLPALNGVTARDALQWVGAFPAIEGVLRNEADGLDWYVLANGDVLTTVNAPGMDRGQAVRRDLILHVRRKDVLPVR